MHNIECKGQNFKFQLHAFAANNWKISLEDVAFLYCMIESQESVYKGPPRLWEIEQRIIDWMKLKA